MQLDTEPLVQKASTTPRNQRQNQLAAVLADQRRAFATLPLPSSRAAPAAGTVPSSQKPASFGGISIGSRAKSERNSAWRFGRGKEQTSPPPPVPEVKVEKIRPKKGADESDRQFAVREMICDIPVLQQVMQQEGDDGVMETSYVHLRDSYGVTLDEFVELKKWRQRIRDL
ncbi:hypothetical protein HDU83_002421 [Entophlyctis luteolus]|nr:hypothetical protein HDU82_007220 [Entophlyctis luteolus]KAJ3347071.1 hypothetical protein HDU83_002421 [Entophlyctis luteolus]